MKKMLLYLFNRAEYQARKKRFDKIQSHIDLIKNRYPEESTKESFLADKYLVISELMKRQQRIWG